jgi:hypothetical protein
METVSGGTKYKHAGLRLESYALKYGVQTESPKPANYICFAKNTQLSPL